MARDIIIEAEKCTGCGLCELACFLYHFTRQNPSNDIRKFPLPLSRIVIDWVRGQAFPTLCRHCQEPPCVDACMASAMHVGESGDIVLLDTEKCVGCWMCVMVCPFAAIIQDNQHKKAVKCDKCLSEKIPWCVSWCPENAIFCGEVEDLIQVRVRNRAGQSAISAHSIGTLRSS